MSKVPNALSAITIVWRVGLAIALGASFGISMGTTNPAPLDVAIADAVLVVPSLLAVALNRRFQRRAAFAVVGGILGLVVVALPLASAGFQAMQGFPGVDTSLLFGAAVVLLPAMAAFALGAEHRGLAIGCALAAWLGFGLRTVGLGYLQGQFQATNGSTEFADIAGLLLTLLFVLGFGLAIAMGLLGRALARRLTR